MTDAFPRVPFALSGTGGRGALLAWTVAFQGAALAVLAWGPLDMAGPWVRLAVYGAFGVSFAAWTGAVVRRLHDTGRSGWFALLFSLPVVGLALLLWALVAPARQLDPDRFRPALRYDVGALVLILIVAVFASRAFWSPHRMPTEAMAPTMPRGALFVSHRVGRDAPRPGDVVMVAIPVPGGKTRRTVARVIASGGQRVGLAAGVPVLDGTAAGRSACPGADCRVETLPGGRSYRIRAADRPTDASDTLVPDGALFLLADNRRSARDSRLSPEAGGLGLVPLSAVEGHVLTSGGILR